MIKQCCTCKVEKETTEFFKNKSRQDGLHRQCKICFSKSGDKIARDKRYYKKNSDKIKKRTKEYYKNNLDKCMEDRRKHYRNNKQAYLVSSKNRREKQQTLDAGWTIEDENLVRNKFENHCFKCGADQKNSKKMFPIDHHYPLNEGNPLTESNAVLLCKSCNGHKWANDPRTFYNEYEILILRCIGINT